MPRLLIWGDAGAPTGFAQVVHNVGDRLARDFGWDVHVLGINYLGDHVDTPMKLYPANLREPRDFAGFSRLIEMVGKVMPDAMLIVNDPQLVLRAMRDNRYDPNYGLWQGFVIGDITYRPPIVAYMPIDGYESPKVWDTLAGRVTRIAMTKFGRDTAMPEASVIWHGVDRDIYKPMDKKEAKRRIGYDPDRFLILRVDANATRKDYPATWKALRPLLYKYSDIDVHFHCLPDSPTGYSLRALMSNDPDIRDRVNFSPGLDGYGGWPEENLALLYAAADLFVSNSWGEGFGLGNLYAMACGTPVVATDCSATTEVVGPGGVLIPPVGRISTGFGQEQCLSDIPAFTRAIEHLYEAGGVRRKLGKKAIEQASRFSWDFAAARFHHLLSEVVDRQGSVFQREPEPAKAG